jgi:hypothetical protein
MYLPPTRNGHGAVFNKAYRLIVTYIDPHAEGLANYFRLFSFRECQTMAIASLSPEEFASLREVPKGHNQVAIPADHETRLCALSLKSAARTAGFPCVGTRALAIE